MTEQEWLACDDYRRMLTFLPGRWTERKARLYVCAGLRQLWHLLFADSSMWAVETGEKDADGTATGGELAFARWTSESPTFGYDFHAPHVRDFIAQGWDENARRLIEMGVYRQEDLQTDGDIGEQRVVTRLTNAANIAHY